MYGYLLWVRPGILLAALLVRWAAPPGDTTRRRGAGLGSQTNVLAQPAGGGGGCLWAGSDVYGSAILYFVEPTDVNMPLLLLLDFNKRIQVLGLIIRDVFCTVAGAICSGKYDDSIDLRGALQRNGQDKLWPPLRELNYPWTN